MRRVDWLIVGLLFGITWRLSLVYPLEGWMDRAAVVVAIILNGFCLGCWLWLCVVEAIKTRVAQAGDEE